MMNLAAGPWRVYPVLFVLIAGASASAAPTRLGDDLVRQIRSGEPRGVASGPIVLPTGEEATLQLEEFDVYAPDAVIEAIGEGGDVIRLPRPDIRYFRGGLEGDPTSLAFLALGKSAQGFIVRKDRKYRLRSMARTKPRLVRNLEDVDIVIEEVELTDEMPWNDRPWKCDVDHYSMDAVGLIAGSGDFVAAMAHVQPNALVSPNATYVLNIAVEGDYELYVRQDNNSSNTATYLSNLVAAASVIYKRDLQTELRIAYSGHHTSVADPFTITPEEDGNPDALDALVEFGAHWHDTLALAAIPRSAAMFVSGKDFGAGIAWLDHICEGDISYTTPNGVAGWAGAYGLLMDAGLSTNFDPDANPDYQADLDSFGSEYWPVLAFAHELGHTVQSRHTHCVILTEQEKVDFGVTRNFVDECFSGETYLIPPSTVVACYTNGSNGAVDANLPLELGTIMSYCHLTDGRGAATRFTFGQTDEPSIKVVNAMKTAIDAKTPSLPSAITAPSSVDAGVATNASITLGSSLSYLWTITNGSINSGNSGTTGGGGTFVVNFTATADPVRLTVLVTITTSGCSASDYADIAVNVAVLDPPTNLVATATSSTNVQLTWTASADAVSYQVHRSIDGIAYAQVGTTGETTFDDGPAIGNTAYLYKVRAVDGAANPSPFSDVDLATTVVFTDPTLTAGVSSVAAIHFTQLRTAVNAVRSLAGLGAVSFTDGVLGPDVPVKAVHLTDLRTNLDAARTLLGLAGVSYTDPDPVGALIQSSHVEELRGGVE